MLAASQRQQWTKAAFQDSRNVYQLALRLGLSFQAACGALASQQVTSRELARTLQEQTVNNIKLSLAPEHLITNLWANVWTLAEADTRGPFSKLVRMFGHRHSTYEPDSRLKAIDKALQKILHRLVFRVL